MASEAFGDLWPQLAERLGLELRIEEEPQPAPRSTSVGVVLACGGEEGAAVELVHAAHRLGVDDPLIVGASKDHRLAVEVMRRGAAAYYALPDDVERLERDLTDRLASLDLPGERSAAASNGTYDFSAIVGDDPALLAALERVGRVIPGGRATVLIIGETGTGKELVAQAIHSNGPRAGQPFVAVNCSAIPATLLESELFGHERGAFTDARSAKPGLLEVADGGTVFLDEVPSLPLEMQAKLLRFLETREVRRVGGVRDAVVDVRILAAANVDLRARIEEGEFREDLYFRLAVMPVELPPLRERGRDVLTLARAFLTRLAAEYELEVPGLSRGAAMALERHSWPGNVRELRNAIERALLLADTGVIEPGHLALAETSLVPDTARATEGGASSLSFPATLDTLEVAAVQMMLERCDGNKSEAARRLGITRTRLYRILQRLP
jgi:DNA-binding NtrC family response regulator